MSELKKKYQENFKLMSSPKIEKIVVAMGVGEAVKDKVAVEKAALSLTEITGQKPYVCRARVSISAFSLRQGEPIGLKVTLRGGRMYDFLEKLIKIALPRFRDFRGASPYGFDQKGNYNLGIPEITVFPEIDFAKLDKIRGLQVTIAISGKDRSEARKLLESLGMPFAKE